MFGMNVDQFGGLVRSVALFVSGIAVSDGLIDQNTAMTVVAAIVAVAMYGWSHYTNQPGTVIPSK